MYCISKCIYHPARIIACLQNFIDQRGALRVGVIWTEGLLLLLLLLLRVPFTNSSNIGSDSYINDVDRLMIRLLTRLKLRRIAHAWQINSEGVCIATVVRDAHEEPQAKV
jgi:hypothetical protein